MCSTKQIPAFILLISFTTMAKAQEVVNMLPCDDYEAITFNGKTVQHLNATNAEPQNVQQLLAIIAL